jgi:paraquat-inducible protein A
MAPGERALCVRCDTVMARGSRIGPDGALAFTVTGLVLAIPAATMPFVTAAKLGSERVSLLFTGVASLWTHGMPEIAALVFLCGGLVPIAFLCCLACLLVPAHFGRKAAVAEPFARFVRLLGHFSMPEVQVLAVLVALMKLGSLVDLTLGPGFWFYGAMSLAVLFAVRCFNLQAAAPPDPSAPPAAAKAR